MSYNLAVPCMSVFYKAGKQSAGWSILATMVTGCGGPVVQSWDTLSDPATSGHHLVSADGRAKDGAEPVDRPPSLMNYSLPKGLLPISLTVKEAKFTWSVDKTVMAADPNFMFSLAYDPSVFRSDDVTFTVSPEGLLTSVKVDTTDQGIAILKGIVDVVSKALVPGVPGAPAAAVGAKSGTPTRVECPKSFTVSGLIDPSDQESIDGFGLLVDASSNGCVSFTAGLAVGKISDPNDKARKDMRDDLEKLASARRSLCEDAICFRAGVPYFARVEESYTLGGFVDSPRTEQSITRYLPNDGPIGYAQMNWRSFIQNKTDVTLDNGMVTELHIVKPSEALGPLAGIGDLFKGIFAIPGALFASDTATINAKNAQLKAEQDNLQAKANLLTAELKYELLRKCLVDNPGHAEKCVAN